MESCKVAASKRDRCRERLKSNGGAIKLAIYVRRQGLGDLQYPPFNFSLFETCHLIQGKNCE